MIFFRDFKHIKAGIRMEIVETWYFQIWVNFGGVADRRLANVQPKHSLLAQTKYDHSSYQKLDI